MYILTIEFLKYFIFFVQVAYVRAALEEQANAFVEFAEKCRTIYSAQRALVELLPENADLVFLSQSHSGELA